VIPPAIPVMFPVTADVFAALTVSNAPTTVFVGKTLPAVAWSVTFPTRFVPVASISPSPVRSPFVTTTEISPPFVTICEPSRKLMFRSLNSVTEKLLFAPRTVAFRVSMWVLIEELPFATNVVTLPRICPSPNTRPSVALRVTFW